MRDLFPEDWRPKLKRAMLAIDAWVDFSVFRSAAGSRGIRHNDSIPLDQFPDNLIKAVLATEDRRFYEHFGIDMAGTLRALVTNVRAGGVQQGGSSITQQLAKNLFLSGSRTWWRKAQEAMITAMLEAVLEKRRILELYLNVVEWGDGVYGAEAAARYHFGAPSAALSPAQAARLAAMLPSPRAYTPGYDTLYLQRQTAAILARMKYAQVP